MNKKTTAFVKVIFILVSLLLFGVSCTDSNEKENFSSQVDSFDEIMGITEGSSFDEDSDADSSQSKVVFRSADEVDAAAVVVPDAMTYSQKIEATLDSDEAAWLYELICEKVVDGDKIEKPSGSFDASVCFRYTDGTKVIVSAYGDGKYGWVQEDGASIFFKTSGAYDEYFYLYAALSVIYPDEQITAEKKASSSGDLLIAFGEDKIFNFYESVGFYIDENTEKCFDVEQADNSFYYCSYYSKQANAQDGEASDYQTDDYYEYIMELDENTGYEKTEENGDWQITDTFTGERYNSLPVQISLDCEASKEIKLTIDELEYVCEIWRADESDWFVLFDSDGNLEAAWDITDDGLKILSGYSCQSISDETLDDTIAEAKENLDSTENTDASQTDELSEYDGYIASDNEEYGLFDLTGEVIKGETIDDPQTVKEYREYFAQSMRYSAESYCTGAGRLEHKILSCDGENHYIRWDIINYDDPKEIGSEEILIGDTVYSSYYDLDEYDERSFTAYGSDEYCDMIIYQILDSEYEAQLNDAYYADVDGIEYECEEWTVGIHDFTVYSKDGEIKAFETDFHGDYVVYTLVSFSFEENEELIKVPENFSMYISDD